MRLDLFKQASRSGVTVIEVLIGAAMVATIVIMVMVSLSLFLDSRQELLTKAKALYAAEQGIELLRWLRDDNWNTIAAIPLNTTYYLNVATSTIGVGATPEILEGTLHREFVVREVYRDATTDDIVASTTAGAVADNGTREVEMRVGDGESTTTLSVLLADIFD